MNQRTDFLVPTASFLVGMGSLLNFSGGYFEYNQSQTPEQADHRALLNDFAMVGQDIRKAMIKVSESPPEELKNQH